MFDTQVVFKDVFKLKDRISHELTNRKVKFDSFADVNEFISRVGYQFYPAKAISKNIKII